MMVARKNLDCLKADWKSGLSIEGKSELSALDTALTEWASGHLADTIDVLEDGLTDDLIE